VGATGHSHYMERLPGGQNRCVARRPMNERLLTPKRGWLRRAGFPLISQVCPGGEGFDLSGGQGRMGGMAKRRAAMPE